MRMKWFAATLLAAGTLGCSQTPTKTATAESAPAAAPVAAPAQAPAAEATKAGMLSCAKEKDARTVEIEAVGKKACNVWYTKFGSRDKIAWSTTGTEHCDKVRGRIEENLKTAGFQCGEPVAAAPAPMPEKK